MSSKESLAWTFFDKEEAIPKKNRCKLCDKHLSNGGGTSNLIDHVRRKHPAQLAEATQAGGNNPGQVPAVLPLAPTSPEKKRLDRLLVKMVAKDYQPLSVVEDRGFIDFVAGLNPKYKPPSRQHLSQVLLPELHAEVTAQVKAEMAAATDVALTTDVWTSRNNEAFLDLTAHYVGSDLALKSLCLGVSVLEKAHTGEYLAAKIRSIIDEFDVDPKVRVIVSDNGSNMKAAIRVLGYECLPCAAHTLNLAVEDAFAKTPNVDDLLRLCNTYTTHFKQSPKSSEILREKRLANGKTAWKLSSAVITRWNSKLEMMRRLLDLKQELIATVAEIVGGPRQFDALEWRQIEQLILVLEPVDELTVALSGEHYPTVASIVPLTQGILLKLQDLAPTTTDFIAEAFLTNLQNAIRTRLGAYESHAFSSAATFLDPRYKKVGFSVQARAEEAEKRVIAAVRGKLLAAQTRQQAEAAEATAADAAAEEAGPAQLPEKRVRLLDYLPQRRADGRHLATASSDAHVLVKPYSMEAARETDPIQYWSAVRSPLSEVALAHLCAPATSVPSERLWSKAGQVITDRRASLSREKAETLIFLKGNAHLF